MLHLTFIFLTSKSVHYVCLYICVVFFINMLYGVGTGLVSISISYKLYVECSCFPSSVHESDTAGHGHEDGEPRRQPWHEARHAAWHGRTG